MDKFVLLWITGMGGLFALGGFAWLWHVLRFVAKSVTATGTVLGHEKEVDSDATYFHPIVEFEDGQGVRQCVTARVISSNAPVYPVGTFVRIRFDPANSAEASVDSFVQLWLFPSFFAALGSVVFAAGIWGVIRR